MSEGLSSDWTVALGVDILRTNVWDVAHIFWNSHIPLLHWVLNKISPYGCVVVYVGCSIHVLFGPLVELVSADCVSLVFGLFLWLKVVVVWVGEEPVSLAHGGILFRRHEDKKLIIF